MKKARLDFKQVEGILYDITHYDSVILCVRAYGGDAVVVDKHRTAMVSKHTTNIDRFDRTDWVHADEVIPWWDERSGVKTARAASDMCDVLDRIASHHTNYIAKIIVE